MMTSRGIFASRSNRAGIIDEAIGVPLFSMEEESSCHSGIKIYCSCSNCYRSLKAIATRAVDACHDFARSPRCETSFSFYSGLRNRNEGAEHTLPRNREAQVDP